MTGLLTGMAVYQFTMWDVSGIINIAYSLGAFLPDGWITQETKL